MKARYQWLVTGYEFKTFNACTELPLDPKQCLIAIYFGIVIVLPTRERAYRHAKHIVEAYYVFSKLSLLPLGQGWDCVNNE